MRPRTPARPAAVLAAAGLVLGGTVAAPALAAVPGFTAFDDVQCVNLSEGDFVEPASLDVFLDFDNTSSSPVDVVVSATFSPGTPDE